METLAALFLGILGASLNAPPLKEITWASEMRRQCVTIFLLPRFVTLLFHPQQNRRDGLENGIRELRQPGTESPDKPCCVCLTMTGSV